MVQQQTIIETAKGTGDALATSAVIGTIAGWLPEAAAGCAIIWFAMQMLMNWDKIKEAFNKHFRGK